MAKKRKRNRAESARLNQERKTKKRVAQQLKDTQYMSQLRAQTANDSGMSDQTYEYTVDMTQSVYEDYLTDYVYDPNDQKELAEMMTGYESRYGYGFVQTILDELPLRDISHYEYNNDPDSEVQIGTSKKGRGRNSTAKKIRSISDYNISMIANRLYEMSEGMNDEW